MEPPWSWLVKHHFLKNSHHNYGSKPSNSPKGNFKRHKKKNVKIPKILIQRIAMGTHLNEIKRIKLWCLLQASSFKRVGSGLEVLMTMVSLFDVYITTKTHRTYCFCFISRFLFFQFLWAFPYFGNLCDHITKNSNFWQRPSDNFIEVFRPDQITNLRARVDGWQWHVVHGVPKSNAPGERIFWEKKSWDPGPSSLVVIYMSYSKQSVKETILKKWCFLAPLKKKVLFFWSLEFRSI